ncbi:MAG TPA: hypothetical protein PLA50_12590 [Bacteroidia bacterium]|nr:hypothetical protein [Bacteroidia bacterium]
MCPIFLELFKAALAGLTAAGVFVLGQILQRFLFDPVVKLRDAISQIESDIVFYCNLYSGPEFVPDEEWNEALVTFRRHSSTLRSLHRAIPYYRRLHCVLRLPSPEGVAEATRCLIGLSNARKNPRSSDYDRIDELFEGVSRGLGIPPRR